MKGKHAAAALEKKGDSGHWMKEAFAGSHGQFKAKAKKAGKSTAAYAKSKEHAGGKLGKQARLAEVGMRYGGGRG